MNDDDRAHAEQQLASSYLDNEVDARDRAQVDDSPELMQLVGQYRSLRSQMSDVAPPPPATRDSALAAALAVFDTGDIDTVPAAGAPAGVIALGPRRAARIPWQRRFLAGAAAAAVVAVVGVAIIANRGTDSKSSSTATEMQADAVPFDANSAADQAADSTPGESVRPTIAVIGRAADVAIVVNSPAELLSLSNQKVATSPAPATADTTPANSTSDDSGVPLWTSTQATAERSQMNGLTCMTDHLQWLADIIYIDTSALAVVNSINGTVQALDANTCGVLAEVMP